MLTHLTTVLCLFLKVNTSMLDAMTAHRPKLHSAFHRPKTEALCHTGMQMVSHTGSRLNILYERGFQYFSGHPPVARWVTCHAASTSFFRLNPYSSSNSIAITTFLTITMGCIKRKTARREHETPKRVRFQSLIEQGYSQREACQRLGLARSTIYGWSTDWQTGKTRPGRRPIISDTKVEEMV
jgi:hypothetical protein